MHIHAWQQFSSNHSAEFTIVGELLTLEEAQRVGAEMRAVLTEIVEWYDRPENASYKATVTNTGNTANYAKNPIEDAIGERYGVDLEAATDWLMAHENEIQRALSVIGRYVILETHNTGDEFMPMNFDKLMSKMGVNAEEYHAVVNVVCDTPDVYTASRIQYAINKHLFFAKNRLPYSHISYPWINSGENRPLGSDPETQSLLQQSGQLADAWYQSLLGWYAIHYPHEYRSARESQNWANLPHLSQAERHTLVENDLLPIELEALMASYRWHEYCGFALVWIFINYTKIERSKTTLRLENLSFYYVGQSLLAMLDWLESLNCTNISFTLHDGLELLKGSEPSG
jgi:hypothetical protein